MAIILYDSGDFLKASLYDIRYRQHYMPYGEKEKKEGMAPLQDQQKTSARFWIVRSKTAASLSASWEIRIEE